MKAIYFNGGLQFKTDHPVPKANKNEALIRVTLAGICNTDMEILRGYLSFHGVIGHEFVGIVEEAPMSARHFLNKRVVGEINCGCGICPSCKSGVKEHCPDRTTLGIEGRDGAFAEYVVLPVSNLHEVPDTVTDEKALFAEPLAAAFEITERVQVRPSDRVLVLGDGKLGILCCYALCLTGAHVTLAGKHNKKLETARLCCKGIAAAIMSSSLKENECYDIVVEATGSPAGLEKAMTLVRPRGIIVLKSTVAGPMGIDLAPLVINEISVAGSRCGPFDAALRAVSEGLIDPRPLITSIYPFEKAEEAFKKAAEKTSLKILIDFQGMRSGRKMPWRR